MTLLTNNKGGKVRASGQALETLKGQGWEEVAAPVISSPTPAPKPRAKRAVKKEA